MDQLAGTDQSGARVVGADANESPKRYQPPVPNVAGTVPEASRSPARSAASAASNASSMSRVLPAIFSCKVESCTAVTPSRVSTSSIIRVMASTAPCWRCAGRAHGRERIVVMAGGCAG